MAGAGAIRAGKAEVEVGADTSPLAAALARAQMSMMSFGGGVLKLGGAFAGVGAAAVAALGVASYAFAERGTQMLHQADMVGASVGFMSALSTGLELAGGSADSAAQSMFRFKAKLAEAIGGSVQAQQAFRRLGVDANSLNGITTDEQMNRMSEGIRGVASQAERARGVIGVFGRGGREMINILSHPGGLDANRERLEKLGLVMSAETAAKGLELHEAFVLMGKSGMSLLNAVLEPMEPLFRAIAEGLAMASRGFREWARNNLQWLESMNNAFMGGSWTLGWEIGLTTMKIAWLDFTSFIYSSIPGLQAAMVNIFDPIMDAFRALQQGWANVFAGIAGVAQGQSLREIIQTMDDIAAQYRGEARERGRDTNAGARQTLTQQLNVLMRRADAMATTRTIHGPEADDIMGRSSGARGTFNSDIAGGLAAPGNNPVADGVRMLHDDAVLAEAARNIMNQRLQEIIETLATAGLTFN